MVLSTPGRAFHAVLFGATLAATTACGAPPNEVIGSVGGRSLAVETAFWGGPFMVVTTADMSCEEMAWVERVYPAGVSPVGTDMVTMQVSFNNSDVAVGTYDVTGEAPISVKWLTTTSGAFNEEHARTGYVEIDDITGKNHVIGSFDLSFDDGNVDGSFDLENCSNLKDH